MGREVGIQSLELLLKERSYRRATHLSNGVAGLMIAGGIASLTVPVLHEPLLFVGFVGGLLGSGLLGQWFEDREMALVARRKSAERATALEAG